MKNKIPKRFIRVWIGSKEIPELFEIWWEEFKTIHPNYDFITFNGINDLEISDEIQKIINKTTTCAGVSDIIRLLALYQYGGIYIDTDVMPIKSFNTILNKNDVDPFLGKRSSKSFETAIIGSPKNHPAIRDVIDNLSEYWHLHKDKTASVQTGPAFVSSILFGRNDIQHLPISTFYPYNGFGAPKRDEKLNIFSDKNNFPKDMVAAHFSNHRWGGKPTIEDLI